MDAVDGFRRSCPRRSVRTALPPAASPPMSCDTGRAAAGRAGSFNSGKNQIWRMKSAVECYHLHQ